MPISIENKILSLTAIKAFGGKPTVSKYWDQHNRSSIDVLSASNRPYDGVTSYSTIGLSDYSIGYKIGEKPLRVEISGASTAEYYPNILATCAFNLINSNHVIAPGEMMKDIIEMYADGIEMKHILFTDPFLWANLKSIDIEDKKVAWLLAVPISENEYLYAQDNGTDALENFFEEKDIDIFGINRKSTL